MSDLEHNPPNTIGCTWGVVLFGGGFMGGWFLASAIFYYYVGDVDLGPDRNLVLASLSVGYLSGLLCLMVGSRLLLIHDYSPRRVSQ